METKENHVIIIDTFAKARQAEGNREWVYTTLVASPFVAQFLWAIVSLAALGGDACGLAAPIPPLDWLEVGTLVTLAGTITTASVCCLCFRFCRGRGVPPAWVGGIFLTLSAALCLAFLFNVPWMVLGMYALNADCDTFVYVATLVDVVLRGVSNLMTLVVACALCVGVFSRC